MSAELLCKYGPRQYNLIEVTDFEWDGRKFMYQRKEFSDGGGVSPAVGGDVSYYVDVYLPIRSTSQPQNETELKPKNCFVKLTLFQNRFSADPNVSHHEILRKIGQSKTLTGIVRHGARVPPEFFESFPETWRKNNVIIECLLSKPNPSQPIAMDFMLLLLGLGLGGLFSTMAYTSWTTPISTISE